MRPETWDAERLTVDLVWTAGAPVRRRDWRTGEEYLEVLSTQPGDVRLGRLQNGAPLLYQHDPDFRAGVVERATETTASVRLSRRDDEAMAGIRLDVADGILRKVSVGYDQGDTYDDVQGDDAAPYNERAGTTGLSVRIFRNWEPHELSLVTIAADDDAGTRSHNPQQPETRANDTEEPTMADTQAPEVPAVDITQVRAAERQRINDGLGVISWARGLDKFDVNQLLALEDEVRTTDIGVSEVRAKLQTLDAVQADAVSTSPAHGVDVVADDADKRSSAISSAIQHRLMGGELPSEAREFRGMRLPGIARHLLAQRGVSTTGKTDQEVVRTALSMQRSGFHTTSDFSHVLLDAMGKALVNEGQTTETTWMRLTRSVTLPDFRDRKVIGFDALAKFKDVPEGGAIEMSTATDRKETWSLGTVGTGFMLTRQAIVNDDLSAFADFRPELLRGIADKKEEDFWSLVTANGNLSDGAAFYNTASGTLASSGAAPDIDTIYAGIQAMRGQTRTVDGETKKLRIAPRFLVYPLALAPTVEKLYATWREGNAVGSGQVPTPAVLGLEFFYARDLDDSSTTAWYLFSDPSVYRAYEYGTLQGAAGLQTAPADDVPSYRGVGIYAWEDFGFGQVQREGAYKNAGA